MLKICLLLLGLLSLPAFGSDQFSAATKAINSLGVDLLAKATTPQENALLSPYSIQSALAMTYAGASGLTEKEMATALHYPENEAELHTSFAALRKAFQFINEQGAAYSTQLAARGYDSQPTRIAVANHLFGQVGDKFRPEFLELVERDYAAPLEQVDFQKEPGVALKRINQWVEGETQGRIQNLLSGGAIDSQTALVLVNALYFKAAWMDEFLESNTKPQPFHFIDGTQRDVPTMTKTTSFHFEQRPDFSIIALTYDYRAQLRSADDPSHRDDKLQFVIFLPSKTDGLPALERKLNAELLTSCTNLQVQELRLFLPKFKLEPGTIPLSQALRKLGMRSAFDQTTANFTKMAPAKSLNRLFISEVFHKTFLSLDEHGTEAAAATALSLTRGGPPPNPTEVHVDRPFLFAIQHRGSGTCLFLGRVVDPR